ncbi:MAG TPA: class I SAM-dependent methyltransferase [Acidobacteriaceae bacterium]|jgi:ubiquinone/menaquinone biosynthesis C-methylase UbiE|nr:class I SAM-dependent methyltransferase [Acidobacteriaceae bacterium]
MKTGTQVIDRSNSADERSWWDFWNTSYRSEDTQTGISAELFNRVVALARKLTGAKPQRIVEVACGTGILSKNLNFSSYYGYDLSEAAIEIARQKISERFPGRIPAPIYEAADFHTCVLPAGPADLVLCIDALTCFRDQQLVLRRVAGLLRNGGLCILTIINPFVYNRIRRGVNVKLENGPVSYWPSRQEVHELFRGADLPIEHSYTIMPRGDMGFLRVVNSARLNNAFGPRFAGVFQHVKETAGLGQYRVIVARKK